jgi:WD40 repeat protein
MTLVGHAGDVNYFVFSPDGKRIVTASDDKTARVWDTKSGRMVATLKWHSNVITYVAFSLDCKFVLTTSSDNTARVWDSETGNNLGTLAIEKLNGPGNWIESASINIE